jgi:uncharacterized protein (TIGR02246 family)
MKIFRSVWLATASAIIIAACGPPGAPGGKHDAAADEAAVRAVNPAWFKAYAAGDAAGVTALYAIDAVLSPPGVSAMRGRSAILDFFTQDIAAIKTADLRFTSNPATDVGVSGDLAWETGQFTVSDKAGAVVDTGKFSTVFTRRDGSWQIIRDTWNSDGSPTVGGVGGALRIVHFTAASADAQKAAMKLVDDEVNALYFGAKGFQWVKYFVDTKSLETGSVSLWSNAADIDAFLNSEGYRPIPGKLKPLMKGAMSSHIYEIRAPAK